MNGIIMEWIQGRKNDVPYELIREILVRLPAKSLVRFRCVHPSWNALFKMPLFVTDHSSHHSFYQHERLMMFPDYKICEMEEYNYLEIHSDDPSLNPHQRVPIPLTLFPSASHLAHKYRITYNFRPVTSSCNDIFLIIFGLYADEAYQLMLWNPATRDAKVVPRPHHLGDHCQLHLHRSFGFGIDRETNDYKIVNLLINPYREANTIATEVYSLSTNLWVTTIHVDHITHDTYLDNNCCFDTSVCSTHAHGVCYWTWGDSASENGGILSFNLSNNQFKLIKFPINNIDNYSYGPGILRKQRRKRRSYERSFLIGDSIAYVIFYRHVNPNTSNIPMVDRDDGLGVWVFKEGEGCWCRTHYIEPFDLDPQICGFWNATGEFLAMKPDEYLVSLDNDNDGQGQIVARKIHTDAPAVFVRNYVETIAPLSL